MNDGNQEKWVEDSKGWAFRVDRGQGWGRETEMTEDSFLGEHTV